MIILWLEGLNYLSLTQKIARPVLFYISIYIFITTIIWHIRLLFNNIYPDLHLNVEVGYWIKSLQPIPLLQNRRVILYPYVVSIIRFAHVFPSRRRLLTFIYSFIHITTDDSYRNTCSTIHIWYGVPNNVSVQGTLWPLFKWEGLETETKQK